MSVAPYLETIAIIERLHRLLLEVIKDEFDRRGRIEVNPIQALLLYNIGDQELTAGELRARGYYLGSNVSYNVKKLTECGYMNHDRATYDRRAVCISLTDKGKKIRDIVVAAYAKHADSIAVNGARLSLDDFIPLNIYLSKLEQFWGNQLKMLP